MSIPRHVAVIMDGNGRWAAARGLPRVAGHREGAKAVRRAMESGMAPAALNEQNFAALLATGEMPDPDLLIRTSGEERISNFLLWQLAYAELFFTDVLWPDFDEQHFNQALEAYAMRERRFGARPV